MNWSPCRCVSSSSGHQWWVQNRAKVDFLGAANCFGPARWALLWANNFYFTALFSRKITVKNIRVNIQCCVLLLAYGCATNNNGFCIGWLDLLTPSFTLSLNYNQLLPRTGSILSGLRLSSVFYCHLLVSVLLHSYFRNDFWFTNEFKSLQLPFPYPWTRLCNTQRWFMSKNRISAGTCFPIRFLETAYMSQYIEYCTVYSYAVVCIKSGFDLKWTLCTLRIPEKMLLRRGQQVTEYCIMKIFVTFPLHEI
jgi:hypothetical protein